MIQHFAELAVSLVGEALNAGQRGVQPIDRVAYLAGLYLINGLPDQAFGEGDGFLVGLRLQLVPADAVEFGEEFVQRKLALCQGDDFDNFRVGVLLDQVHHLVGFALE